MENKTKNPLPLCLEKRKRDKRNKISVLYIILKSAQEGSQHQRGTWSLSSGSQKYLSASFSMPNP